MYAVQEVNDFSHLCFSLSLRHPVGHFFSDYWFPCVSRCFATEQLAKFFNSLSDRYRFRNFYLEFLSQDILQDVPWIVVF